MEKLIEMIESAASGGRNLDALIEVEVRRWQAYEVGLNDKQRAHWKPIGNKGEIICTQGITRYHPPLYSFNIDAAAELVPEGKAWTLGQNVHHLYWQASINATDDDGAPFSLGCSNATKTAALALCAAALRARAPSVTRPHLSTPEKS